MNRQALLIALLIITLVLLFMVPVKGQKPGYESPPLDLDPDYYKEYKKETRNHAPIPTNLSAEEREKLIDEILKQQPISKEKAIPSLEIPSNNQKFPEPEYVNEFGVPIGDRVSENNIYDGIDNDNDGVIDEGSSKNNCHIAVFDCGQNKDDEFELIINEKPLGKNTEGRARFWHVDLEEGYHKVALKGLSLPDGFGTYRIWFNKCQVSSGSPLTGIIRQGYSLNWTVKSGPAQPTPMQSATSKH